MKTITFLFSFLAFGITTNAQNAGFNIQDATDPDGLGGYSSIDTGNGGSTLDITDVNVTNGNAFMVHRIPAASGAGRRNGVTQTFSPALDPTDLQFATFAVITRGANTFVPRSPGPNNILTATLTTDIGDITSSVVLQTVVGFDDIPEVDAPVYNFDFSSLFGAATEVTKIEFHMGDGGDPEDFQFSQSRIYDISFFATNPLSTAEVLEIPGTSITAKGGSITVEGANLDTVYALTGQQVNAHGLSNGIYIVRVSKGAKYSTLKVIMN